MSATAHRPAYERFAPTTAPSLAPLPALPNIIVVCAGAAGIAAARALTEAGLSAAALEARARVGGRALTASMRGHAVDLGAPWLYASPINPLVVLGRTRAEPLREAPQDSHLVVGRRFRNVTEHVALDRAFAISEHAVARAAASPKDRAAASLETSRLGPWPTPVDCVHALVSGRPLDEVSLHDWVHVDYADNCFIAGGYGAYLARLTRGLPVALGAPVRRIDGSQAKVLVETSDGAFLNARVVIVTFPIPVLQRSVRFEPALPHEARGDRGVPHRDLRACGSALILGAFRWARPAGEPRRQPAVGAGIADPH